MFYGFLGERKYSHIPRTPPTVKRKGFRLFVDFSDKRSHLQEREKTTLAFWGRVYGTSDLHAFFEPLLKKYEERGDAADFFRSFEGDFSLLLYNHDRQYACLGRDCFARGEIYWNINPALSFFTHPQRFFRITGFRPSINRGPLWDRFAIGAITPPETVYENIFTPVTGEYIEIDKEGATKRVPYWSPLQVVEDGGAVKTKDVAAFIREARTCFLDRVGEEIAPYRKLGAGLSGGMDSAAILGAARKRFEGEMIAVTVGPYGPGSPDLAGARKSAAFNKAKHIEYYPAAVDLEDFPKVMGSLAQPFRSGSTFMNHQVAKRVFEEGGECVLWGFGADLIFGNAGYCRRFYRQEAGALPSPLVSPLISMLGVFPQNRVLAGVTNRLVWLRGPANARLGEKYFRVCKKPRFYQERRLFRSQFLEIGREEEIMRRLEEILGNGRDLLVERLIEADFKVVHMYHQVSGTHQVCRLSHVDALITYYNRIYAELNLRVTNSIRALDGWNKYALREAFKPFVHPDIYSGVRGACIIRWDRIISGPFRDAVIRYLRSSTIVREIFKIDSLDRLERLIKHPGLMYLNLLGLALWYDVNFKEVDCCVPLSTILDYQWQPQDADFEGRM